MRNTRGFTLLELLIATMLTTLLMMGVVAVVAGMGSSAAGVAPPACADAGPTGQTARAEDIAAWVGMLRDDLNQARLITRRGPGVLAMVGYASLDAQRREITHRPVTLVYKIEDIDGLQWVIRRQAALDVLTNQNVQRDLVCCGVTRFEVVMQGWERNNSATPSANEAIWRLRVWVGAGELPAHDVIVAPCRRGNT